MVTVGFLADHMDLIPEMASLAYAEWKHLYVAAGISPEGVRATFVQRAVKNKIPLTLVALKNASLVGMGDLKLSESTDPGLSPWLSTVYVKESERGRGIGALIVRALEQRAAELGVERLYLSTETRTGFYLKLGWQVRNAAFSFGHNLTVMEKPLGGLGA